MDDSIVLPIAFWCDASGNSPVTEEIKSFPTKDRDRITKRLEVYRRKPFLKLKDVWERVKGLDETLYELKYKITPPYRSFCVVHRGEIVILVLFKGSASIRKLREKNVKVALQRANDLKMR